MWVCWLRFTLKICLLDILSLSNSHIRCSMPPVAVTCWGLLVQRALRWRARGIQSPEELPIEARRKDSEARAAFAVWHRSSVVRPQLQPVGEACVLCGLITSSWCKSCEVACTSNPAFEASAVCSVCDQDAHLVCHLCQERGLVYPDVNHELFEITGIGRPDGQR